MNNFLPTGEKEPEVSNYMRLEAGENRFRILSSAIVGNEYWVTEGEKRTPVRKRIDENISIEDLGIDKWGNPEKPKYFWAFVVYNYEAKKVQILEITQTTIRKPIKALTLNKKWGDPHDYDIVVTKTGTDKETEYQVTPDPKELLDPAIVEAYEAMAINLEALFEGGDPFSTSSDKPAGKTEKNWQKVGKTVKDEVSLDKIKF